MSTQTIIDDLSNRLSELIAKTPAADIKKNTHALLSGLFVKMDLVTREEFDGLMETRAWILELQKAAVDWKEAEEALDRVNPRLYSAKKQA